jgi:hypothetical protein
MMLMNNEQKPITPQSNFQTDIQQSNNNPTSQPFTTQTPDQPPKNKTKVWLFVALGIVFATIVIVGAASLLSRSKNSNKVTPPAETQSNFITPESTIIELEKKALELHPQQASKYKYEVQKSYESYNPTDGQVTYKYNKSEYLITSDTQKKVVSIIGLNQ